jgi:hypothetical protein
LLKIYIIHPPRPYETWLAVIDDVRTPVETFHTDTKSLFQKLAGDAREIFHDKNDNTFRTIALLRERFEPGVSPNQSHAKSSGQHAPMGFYDRDGGQNST